MNFQEKYLRSDAHLALVNSVRNWNNGHIDLIRRWDMRKGQGQSFLYWTGSDYPKFMAGVNLPDPTTQSEAEFYVDRAWNTRRVPHFNEFRNVMYHAFLDAGFGNVIWTVGAGRFRFDQRLFEHIVGSRSWGSFSRYLTAAKNEWHRLERESLGIVDPQPDPPVDPEEPDTPEGPSVDWELLYRSAMASLEEALQHAEMDKGYAREIVDKAEGTVAEIDVTIGFIKEDIANLERMEKDQQQGQDPFRP